ncbi:uncharacterized protein AB9X84_023970 [Acanthopagrus schlegelii]
MAPKIKKAIQDFLENLTERDFKKFCQALVDRSEKPRIATSRVEGKDFLDVTNVIVITFGEAEALDVVIELLAECKINATDLESKTRKRPKAFLDNGDPAFPRTSSGELETEPSREALKIVADQKQAKASGNGGNVKKPEEVEADAKAHVRAEGGNPSHEWLVLSRFIIQFGKYKGQTFKWLLENHVGYAVYVVATHQDERKWNREDQSPLMVHKDFLTQYSIAYAEVLKEVKLYPAGGQPSTASSSRPAQGKQKTSWKKKSFTPYNRY